MRKCLNTIAATIISGLLIGSYTLFGRTRADPAPRKTGSARPHADRSNSPLRHGGAAGPNIPVSYAASGWLRQ